MEAKFDYTPEQLAEMFTWPRFNGFVGETCGQCKKTANVPHGAGWFCKCGAYNAQFFHGGMMPHEHPDYGVSAEEIRQAVARARSIKSQEEFQP